MMLLVCKSLKLNQMIAISSSGQDYSEVWFLLIFSLVIDIISMVWL